jgi:hypothetical protein
MAFPCAAPLPVTWLVSQSTGAPHGRGLLAGLSAHEEIALRRIASFRRWEGKRLSLKSPVELRVFFRQIVFRHGFSVAVFERYVIETLATKHI